MRRAGSSRRLAWLKLLSVLPAVALGVSDQAQLEDRLADLFGRWDRSDTPGAVVAVAREGRLVHAQAFGLASLEFGLPISEETAFPAGSVAKQFTATAILMLAAAGRLSLDDRVRQHIPELPDITERITLSQLLTHTSGLRDIWALTDLAGWMPADVRTTRQALDLLSRQQALNFKPGSSFGYSNSGYLLLAEVVARTTGQSFVAWTREHLFAPLGMMKTYFYSAHDRILPDAASSYRSLGRSKGFARDILNSGIVGGGNLVTTAADLARWSHYLMNADLAGVPLLERLSEQPVLPGGLRTGYGLGLFFGSHRGRPIAHHGGASAGYRSHLLMFTEEALTVIVLANVNTVNADRLARGVADVVLGDELADPAETEDSAALTPQLPPRAYAGLYALGPDVLLDVRETRQQLYFLLRGTTPREMVPAGGHAFVTAEPGVTLEFTADEDGTITAVQLQVPGRTLQGQRLPPYVLTESQARRYEGRYFSPELETYYEVIADQGGLLVRRLRGEDIPLRPISKDRFLDTAVGDLMVTFSRRRAGRVVGLSVSVERARNIRFDKQ